MRRSGPQAPSGYGLYGYDQQRGNRTRRGAPCGCLVLVLALLAIILAALVCFAPRLIGDASLKVGNVELGPTTVTLTERVDEEREARLQELGSQQDGLGYAALTDAQQKVYVQLLDGVTSLEEKLDVLDATIADVEPAYHAMMVDHPELFWIDGSTRYTYYENGGPITITPGLSLPLDEVPEVRERIEAAADGFLATLPQDADEYAICKATYEYLVETTDYVANAEQHQNIQSVFLGHATVCAGYSKAYQYLLQRAGVFCSYVEGTIPSRGEDHAWNIVRIGGEYSYVDVTWADPAFPGSEEVVLQTGVTYDYLCLTTQEILRDDHAFLNESMWPVCDSTTYDYYGMTGRLFDVVDEAALSASFWSQCDEGLGYVSFKFTNDEAYVAARDSLAAGTLLAYDIQSLFEQQGKAGSPYSYQYMDSLRILRVYV